MNKRLLIIVLFISVYKSHSQLDKDTFSFNYTLAPSGNDGIDYTKTDLRINIPVKLKNGFLTNSIGFDYFDIGYKDTTINTDELEQFYQISYGLRYLYTINKKWKLSAQVGATISSNLIESLSSDDFTFRGGLTALKRIVTHEKPSLLMFGINYSAIFGKPRALPFISFSKKVSDKFSYGIGFPSTFVKYTVNDRSLFKASFWLNGFYANLSNQINLNLPNEAQSASFRAISLVLDYNYKMDENWSIVFKGGYSFSNSYELFDQDNNQIHDFNLGSKPYFSTGVKLNLNYIKQNKKNYE